MITHYPISLGAAPAPERVDRTVAPAPADTWRYPKARWSRRQLAVAGTTSAAVHLLLLFGFERVDDATTAAPANETRPMIAIVPPQIQELEEPEPLPGEMGERVTDMATLVPMQADLPQLPQPSDFVQQLNFTSLLEKPDFSNLDVNVIPESFRGGRKLAESIGNIFNLADLDRIPEPMLQPPPQFPLAMRREAITGHVLIEFIVDTRGAVLDPVIVESSHFGFNDAALAGVSRWKFRPGIREGRKVNTRMRVPMTFAVREVD